MARGDCTTRYGVIRARRTGVGEGPARAERHQGRAADPTKEHTDGRATEGSHFAPEDLSHAGDFDGGSAQASHSVTTQPAVICISIDGHLFLRRYKHADSAKRSRPSGPRATVAGSRGRRTLPAAAALPGVPHRRPAMDRGKYAARRQLQSERLEHAVTCADAVLLALAMRRQAHEIVAALDQVDMDYTGSADAWRYGARRRLRPHHRCHGPAHRVGGTEGQPLTSARPATHRRRSSGAFRTPVG